jgi:hypothetical protein
MLAFQVEVARTTRTCIRTTSGLRRVGQARRDLSIEDWHRRGQKTEMVAAFSDELEALVAGGVLH